MITAALIAIVFGQPELLLTRFSRDPQGRCEIWRYQSGGPARRILSPDIALNDDYLTMQFQLAVSPSGDRFLQAVGVSSKGPNDVVELRQYNVDGGPLRKDRVELEYAKGALYGSQSGCSPPQSGDAIRDGKSRAGISGSEKNAVEPERDSRERGDEYVGEV